MLGPRTSGPIMESLGDDLTTLLIAGDIGTIWRPDRNIHFISRGASDNTWQGVLVDGDDQLIVYNSRHNPNNPLQTGMYYLPGPWDACFKRAVELAAKLVATRENSRKEAELQRIQKFRKLFGGIDVTGW